MSIDITQLKHLFDSESVSKKAIEKDAEARVQELNKFFNDRKKFYAEEAKRNAESASTAKDIMADCVRKIKDLELMIDTNKRNVEYYLYNQAKHTQLKNDTEDLMQKLKEYL